MFLCYGNTRGCPRYRGSVISKAGCSCRGKNPSLRGDKPGVNPVYCIVTQPSKLQTSAYIEAKRTLCSKGAANFDEMDRQNTWLRGAVKYFSQREQGGGGGWGLQSNSKRAAQYFADRKKGRKLRSRFFVVHTMRGGQYPAVVDDCASTSHRLCLASENPPPTDLHRGLKSNENQMWKTSLTEACDQQGLR